MGLANRTKRSVLVRRALSGAAGIVVLLTETLASDNARLSAGIVAANLGIEEIIRAVGELSQTNAAQHEKYTKQVAG